MSDYTPTQLYVGKDSLPVDDPDKLILGFDLDAEYLAVQVAVATKFDVTDIATTAQAEAGTSDAVLMTPLKTTQFLAQSGGSGAGIVNDLLALTDPDADRILFWDDSVGAAAYLTVSTGLTLSGTNLTADASAITHDDLSGFVANEHIDHTGVTITLTEGLQYSSGGTDISASATAKLDISGLTQELTLDTVNDVIVFYDNSAGLHRKVPLDSFIGTALGDGKWFKSTSTALSDSVEITIAYNTADYDALEKGTFSTVTGEYTVGAAATRLQITAYATATAPENTGLQIKVQVDGVTKAQSADTLTAGAGTSGNDAIITTNLSVAAGAVVRIRAFTGAGGSGPSTPILAGVANNAVSIVELA